jgi:hypothetical protein
MTRSVDLSGVSSASLTFDTWYDLATAWNYGYVTVSTDDGATWKALPASGTTPLNGSDNRYGVAYGPGFTDISNPQKPYLFPILGILLKADGVSIVGTMAGSGAEKAGIQAGDVVIGHDHQEWAGAPDIFALLSGYAPGNTLNLYVQRGAQKLDMPIVLGSRLVVPPPIWVPQTVDLTPYAGEKILLRFEYVSLPQHDDEGFAVDNVAIPALNWTDDGSGWTMDGWSSVDNQLPQRWIVQAGTSGTQTAYPRVQHWIGTDDSASEGEWKIALDAGETLTVVVSGANDDTTARANFSLKFTVPEGEGTPESTPQSMQ